MAVLFKGEVEVMLNRHSFMGDGITLRFPEFLVFNNTGGKYTLQFKNPGAPLRADYESVADAYIAAQVHLGKLELKEGMYVPVEKGAQSGPALS